MTTRKKIALYLVAAAILAVVAQTINHFRIHQLVTNQQTREFFQNNKFMVGVNYPWVSYGSDFGDSYWGHVGVSDPATAAVVEHDFADLESQHITVVRWFLWANGHAGLTFAKDGSVSGLDKDFFADMNEALEIAARHNIRIVFVLLDFKFFEGPQFGDFGNNWGGHAAVVSNAKIHMSFLNNAVRPLMQQYGKSPVIAAWEVINEPELELGFSVQNGRQSFSPGEMKDFVASVAHIVHRYADQPVTVGSLSRNLLWLWQGVGLDFYEAHSYPYTSFLEPVKMPLPLDRPTLLGEFPTKNGRMSVAGYLNQAVQDGYQGAFPWSYRAPDNFSSFAGARKSIARWQKTH
ncbi:MAG TPA: hypothetical protein V6C81_02695 [Planktothrix sp.]|jgi:hypothetical protein